MKREYKDYLVDIVEAIERIEKFIKDTNFQDFEKDDKTVFAVIRLLEIIGEAVKKIPNLIKNEYPQVPWKKITGMRDKLIHAYFGVDLGVIWKTINKDIPKIKPIFIKILKNKKY